MVGARKMLAGYERKRGTEKGEKRRDMAGRDTNQRS